MAERAVLRQWMYVNGQEQFLCELLLDDVHHVYTLRVIDLGLVTSVSCHRFDDPDSARQRQEYVDAVLRGTGWGLACTSESHPVLSEHSADVGPSGNWGST
jgi:hypothetical protein